MTILTMYELFNIHTKIIRLIRDTVTTSMIPALRWAAMRAILMFQ